MPKADTARRERVGSPRLPSVDQVLRTPAAALGIEQFGRAAVVDAVRAELAFARKERQVLPGDELARAALVLLEARAQPSLRPVFNLTGRPRLRSSSILPRAAAASATITCEPCCPS